MALGTIILTGGVLAISCIFSVRAAGDVMDVTYGGFAFAGNFDSSSKAYPYSQRFDKGAGEAESAFERIAVGLIKKKSASLQGLRVNFGIADKSKSPQVLALALTEERVLIERMGEIRKLVIQLGFELLVLNYENKQVVCSLPIFIDLIDAKKSDFQDNDIVARLKSMVEGSDSQLAEVMNRKLEQLHVRSNNASTLQIIEVKIGEKAYPFLPKSFRTTPSIYSQAVAQQFGGLLSTRAGVALLPFSKDAANAKMSLRFSAGDDVNFTIPKPTYGIALEVKGFKKVLDKQTEAESVWIYGAWLDVKVYEPEFGKLYFKSTLKYPVTKLVPASQNVVDEFPIVSEALKGAIIVAIEAMQNDIVANSKVLSKCKL